MKKSFVFVCTGLLVLFTSGLGLKKVGIKNPDLRSKPMVIKAGDTVAGGDTVKGLKAGVDFGKIPLYFISNQGQVNEKARFYAKASKYTLWLTKEGLVFDGVKRDEVGTGPGHPLTRTPGSPKVERDISRFIFLDANKNPEMVPIKEATLRVNYFIGNDTSKWHGGIPTSMAVLYKNLYDNINLKVYGLEKQIEYDWIVKPGGNPENIRFQYQNVKGSRINDEGNLLIETDFGVLVHKKPVSYQWLKTQKHKGAEAKREMVKAGFIKIGENTYGFDVGPYDSNRELIIDPVVLAYSTYLGGGSNDWGYEIAVDCNGFVYVVGVTSSSDFPTLNQYQGNLVYYDAFVAKLDTTRAGVSSLLYSTYLGGGGFDKGMGIAVDDNGHAYVAGETWSWNFPTLNRFQGNQGTEDGFVTRLDTNRSGVSSMIYSTYLGGSGMEIGGKIAVDGNGTVCVTGWTTSSNFPTLNQYQGYQGGYDGYAAMLDTNRAGVSSLIYSTYLGGSGSEHGKGIAVDGNRNVYVAGWTDSSNFPTLNQYQGDQGDWDVFAVRLDANQVGASSLLYSTYLGGDARDLAHDIQVIGNGNAYITGYTRSSNFPTLNRYQGYQGSDDVFIAGLDMNQVGASSLIYSTYLGGGGNDYGQGIALDGKGHVYVAGQTDSSNFPVLEQYQGYQGSVDAFLTKLDMTRSGVPALLYSTYLGGGGNDYILDIGLDGKDNVCVIGYTFSSNFPTLNSYQEYQGGIDVFVAKLISNRPPVAVCKNIELAADENCRAFITASMVDGGSYDPDEGDEITLSLDNTGPFGPGSYDVELTVTDREGASDSCFAVVTVADETAPTVTGSAVSPDTLWPPNHKMAPVTVSVETTDNCDSSPVSKIVAVESNEPEDGTGDGSTSPDWEITGDLTLNLRAERSGSGTGRIYTITVQCGDASGNVTTGIVTVLVPKNKKK